MQTTLPVVPKEGEGGITYSLPVYQVWEEFKKVKEEIEKQSEKLENNLNMAGSVWAELKDFFKKTMLKGEKWIFNAMKELQIIRELKSKTKHVKVNHYQ